MTCLESVNQFLKANEGIIGFLSVIATFSAVWVSLRIAKQSITAKLKVRLNAKATTVQLMYPGSAGSVPEIPDLEIILHNIGTPDVYVRRSSFFWCLPFPFKFSLPMYIRDSHPMTDPTCINAGSSISIHLETVDWEIRRIIEDPSFTKFAWIQKFLYLEIVTDSHVKFKAPIPNQIKTAIIYHFKKQTQ